MNRMGEWGQNLPPKLEVVDDIWGDETKLPKRKKWKQSVGEVIGEKSSNKDKVESKKKRQRREPGSQGQSQDEQSLSLAETVPDGVGGSGDPAEVKTWANLREKERNQSIIHFFQQPSSKLAENGVSKGGRAEKVWDLDNPRGKWGAGGPESENFNQWVSQDASKEML